VPWNYPLCLLTAIFVKSPAAATFHEIHRLRSSHESHRKQTGIVL
jgi:hypothetical protein